MYAVKFWQGRKLSAVRLDKTGKPPIMNMGIILNLLERVIHLASYQTNQKKELLAFLEKHKDKAFTIEEIARAMEQDSQFSAAPGKSTIYRLMPILVEKNIVKRFSRGSGVTAAYQIVGGKNCLGHMHLKCTSCGRLFHMSDEDSQLLTKQIEEKICFTVDPVQTLLYGQCGQCRLSSEQKESAGDNYETNR